MPSKHESINQSIYLCQYVGWGCPDHPSQSRIRSAGPQASDNCQILHKINIIIHLKANKLLLPLFLFKQDFRKNLGPCYFSMIWFIGWLKNIIVMEMAKI